MILMYVPERRAEEVQVVCRCCAAMESGRRAAIFKTSWTAETNFAREPFGLTTRWLTIPLKLASSKNFTCDGRNPEVRVVMSRRR